MGGITGLGREEVEEDIDRIVQSRVIVEFGFKGEDLTDGVQFKRVASDLALLQHHLPRGAAHLSLWVPFAKT
ncbi:hypothetical protein Pyn_13295 [Prunus yedoensis var. nudiflora]|uniref:Uncharacterized protein n=1 Tax=Prunus yedoensis var. nudiflora TaxID=2094558 RepID=A0A314UWA6_PRUYE|nr:hypothetical protein Pyn_13295 [Prunus yedoensis var. nudiflora]